ncbi:MAG: type IV pilus twitching motility protein PilT [Chloroflexi bacterium]|nr:type IV pilus twitching motility protein PilT [Chloroflexota bacterium]
MDVVGLISLAAEKGASDLHLAAGASPIVRLHGKLQALPDTETLTPDSTFQMLEDLADQAQRQEFLAERELDFAYAMPGLRCRINASWERGAVSIACRLLPLQVPAMEQLKLPPVCKQLASRPAGLVLITGPTGSGKSTTLASMIDYLNHTQSHRIVTVEDPIEYVYTNDKCMILQREVGKDTRSFSEALRRALRQDPNVIMVGEMRDLETMATALTAAETGHLVLSTLHTVDTVQTVDRIVDMFPPHQQHQIRVQLSMVLEGVLSQRLLANAEGTGRVAAIEVLLANFAIRNLVREGDTHELPSYLQLGYQEGMQTMDRALTELVAKGLVSLDTALAVARNPDEVHKGVLRAGGLVRRPPG